MTSSSSTLPIDEYPIVIPNNVTGLTIFGRTSDEEPRISCTLPPIHGKVTRRKEIYKDKDAKRGAKSSLRKCNVILPDLSDYSLLALDPGTSSMSIRLVRRANGVTKETKKWETMSFLVDSTLITQVKEYFHSLIDLGVDLGVVEVQIPKFGLEFTQHIFIEVCDERKVPVVLIQATSRYTSFGLPPKMKGKKDKIVELGLDILEEEGDVEGLRFIQSIKGVVCKNGAKVSAGKRRSDLLDTITIGLCAEALLIQAAETFAE